MNGADATSRAAKGALREDLRRRLHGLSPGERAEHSEQIRRRCTALPEWASSRVIALYHPRRDEPDLWPLVESARLEGKEVVLPSHDAALAAYRWRRVDGPGDLEPGRFGITEPSARCPEVPTPRLDLAFVPGLGFSPDGVRLGRGLGFYDRLLKSFRGRCFGVAFDFQVLPRIPREDHDVGLAGVITPSGCWFAPSGAK